MCWCWCWRWRCCCCWWWFLNKTEDLLKKCGFAQKNTHLMFGKWTFHPPKGYFCSQNCRFEAKKSGFMLRPNCARVDQLLRLGSGRLANEAKMLWILMEFWKIQHWLYCLWRVDKFWWSYGLMNGHNWVNFRPPSKLGGLNLLVGLGRRSLPSVYLKQKGRT